MATSSHPYEDCSDQKCSESCGLRFGLSDKFEHNIIEQQKIKASKAQIKSQIFHNPKENAKYKHMMDDVILKTFDEESEKKIFRKSLEGMESNYPEIFNRTEKHMFYCPLAFNFDSRIGEKEISVPEFIDDMKSCLEAKSSLTKLERANLKAVQKHLRKLRPQLAEQEFVDALACFFYQYRGIFIHSLKLSEHLKVLSDKAKLYRRQNKGIGFEFTYFEKKMIQQFNISERELNDFADDCVKYILSLPNVSGCQPLEGRFVQGAIDNQLTGDLQMCVRKLFQSNQYYSLDDIRNGCKLGKFDSEVNFAGESDLLIMLPDSKLVLSIEIKRHMTCNNPDFPSKATSRIDKNMRSASSQLNKNAKFISSRHGAILSPSWKFVKICAISPSFNHSEKICGNCRRFILTSDILKTQGGLNSWLQETGLTRRFEEFDQRTKDEAYNEFQLFFHRLVCLSSVRVVPDPFHTWDQIQGDNSLHISAGHTRAGPKFHNQQSYDCVDVGHRLHGSLDAYKVLFFNNDQWSLLAADNLHRVLFMCDYGAGNQMQNTIDRKFQIKDRF